MTREKIIVALCRRLGTYNMEALLNILQDRGLVSDNCVTMLEVADRDLIRIYQG
jgi:hypothetical protein